MPDRLSIRDRVLILDQLSQTAFWLNRLATWLAEHDAITESDKCKEAAEKLCTAAWLLERRSGRSGWLASGSRRRTGTSCAISPPMAISRADRPA